MVVFGLATSHDSEVVSKQMQVRPGDQPGYPKDSIESFVGHSSMGLLCPLLSKKFYIFSDGSHTHPAKAGFHVWKNIAVLRVDARIVVNLRNCDLQGCCQSIQKLSSKLAAELGSRRGSSCVPPFSMGR